MYFKPRDTNENVANPVNVRCPHCQRLGSMGGYRNVNDIVWSDRGPQGQIGPQHAAGMRRCANIECAALIFVVVSRGSVIASYPPETIDFDPSSIPDPILKSLEEAVKCHAAEAHRASALMVRRVLEEVCADKGAAGRDLKARLAALGGAALIPAELLEAADELRILGNDAAHIEAREYDAIGKNEAEIAIELAKEILKATYQYGSLVARLRGLRRPRDDGQPA